MNKPEVSKAQLERVIGRLFDEIQSTKQGLASVQRAQDTKHTILAPGESIKQLGEDGRVVAEIGGNGGNAVKHVDGPTPNQPEAPEVEVADGQFTVIVDGYDIDGEPAPQDLARTIVHYSREDGFDAYQGTNKGTITGASGQKVFGVSAGTLYVRVQWETLAGKLSAPSEQVMVEIEPPVDAQDIQDTLDTAQERLNTYRDEVAAPRFQALETGLSENADNLADARDRLTTAEQTLSPLPGRIESAERDVETAKEAAESAEARAVEASNNASNRLQNGGFELGLDHWSVTNVSLSDDAHTGNQAALIGSGGSLSPDASIPVSEGDVWDVSAYAKNGTELVIEVLDAATSGALETFTTPTAASWSETGRLRVEVPADVSYVNIRITGDGVLVDDVVLRDVTDVVRLERAATTARQTADQALAELEMMRLAVDGEGGLKDRLDSAESELETKADTSALDQLDQKLAGDLAAFEAHYTRIWRQPTPPPAGTSYEWAGTPHASESIKRVDGEEVTRNFATITTVGSRGSATRTIDVEFNGERWIQFHVNTTAHGGRINLGTRQSVVDAFQPDVPATVGWDIANPGAVPIRVDVDWGDNSSSPVTVEPGQVRRIVHTGIAVAASYRFSDVALFSPVPGTMLVRNVSIEPGETVGSYFDGDTASDRAHDLWYNQDGVPHEWVNGEGWVELDDQRLGQLAEDIVSAKDSAISQAATDAQTRADAARADAEATAKVYADLVADGAEEAAIAEADRLHGIAVAAAEAAQQRAEEAHSEAGTAWTHADAAMNRAVTAETNAITEARAELAALEIGARNYLLDSEHSPSFRYLPNIIRDPITTGVEDGVFWISGYHNDNPDNLYISSYVGETWEAGRGTIYSDNFFPLPELYTQSMEVMSDEPVTVQRIGSSETSVTLTPGEWTRFSHTQEPGVRPRGVSVPDTGIPAGTRLYIRHWKLERGSKATDWTPAPEDIQVRIAQAKEDAQAHADNMPKSLGGTTPPTGTAPDGSVWRQRDSTNTIIARWERINGSWVPQQVSGEVIDNLEAGKITALYTEFAESVIGTIWGQLGVFDRLEAREGWIGGVNLADGAITAEKIEATRELITRIMGAEWAYISERLVVEGDLIANHADVISAAIKNLSVTERADLFEAFITTLGAQEAVIDLLIGTEAWIGGTMLKDDTVTTRHLEVTETMVGNIAELLHLVVDRIDVNSLWADQTWQAAGHFGSEDADQQTRVDGSGVQLYRLIDGELIPAAIFGGGDVELTFLDGERIVGSIRGDGTITGQQINAQQYTYQGRALIGDALQDSPHPILDTVTQAYVARNHRIMASTDGANTSHYGFLPLSFPAIAGHTYNLVVPGFRLWFMAQKWVDAQILYTTDGTQPVLSSPVLFEQRAFYASNANLGHFSIPNFTAPFHAETTGTVRLLLALRAEETTSRYFHASQYVEMLVQPTGITPESTGETRDVTPSNPDLGKDTEVYWTAWRPSWVQAYLSGAKYSGPSANRVLQGTPTGTGTGMFTSHTGGYRNTVSVAGETGVTINTALAGAKTTRGTLTLTGRTGTGAFHVHWHAYTTTPATFPPGTIPPNYIGTMHITPGQETHLDLPQTVLNAIAANTFQGFSFHPRAATHDGISANGIEGPSPTQPLLRLQYVR